MTTLPTYLLLFDAECPVCTAYSKALVEQGLIDSNGRKAYQQELGADTCPLVDKQRAVNEIALVNLETGEVSYGIESILKLYAARYTAIRTVVTSNVLIGILRILYGFISLNRRVIMPPNQPAYRLQPELKMHYRVAYLFFTWFATAFILTKYAGLLAHFVPVGDSFREYLICGGQIIFQGFVISLIEKDKFWDYLGNMMTISFAGALLLGLMLVAASFIGHNPILYLGYFLAVAGLMFLEHIRRSKLLQIGWWLTISWVCYRLFVLVLILT